MKLKITISILALTTVCFGNTNKVNFKDFLEFVNDMYSSKCIKLEINGKENGWFHKIYKPKHDTWTLAYRCKLYDQKQGYGFELKDGMVHGGILSSEPVKINLTTGKIDQLNVKKWTELSNPSFCKKNVAYWKVDGNKKDHRKVIAVAVFDLENNKEIQSINVGSDPTATDNRNYFKPASWNETCSKASFATPKPDNDAVVIDVR